MKHSRTYVKNCVAVPRVRPRLSFDSIFPAWDALRRKERAAMPSNTWAGTRRWRSCRSRSRRSGNELKRSCVCWIVKQCCPRYFESHLHLEEALNSNSRLASHRLLNSRSQTPVHPEGHLSARTSYQRQEGTIGMRRIDVAVVPFSQSHLHLFFCVWLFVSTIRPRGRTRPTTSRKIFSGWCTIRCSTRCATRRRIWRRSAKQRDVTSTPRCVGCCALSHVRSLIKWYVQERRVFPFVSFFFLFSFLFVLTGTKLRWIPVVLFPLQIRAHS